MGNLEIRTRITEKRLHFYEVAEALGIADSTFSRWLRKELPEDEKVRILAIIDCLSREVR